MTLRILLILSIILSAFLVRLAGLNYGLPFTYHDDEPIIVNYALAYGSGDIHPHVFKISPLLSYILFFIYGSFFVIGYVFRIFQGVNDFVYLYLTNPSIFYLIARIIFGLVCGTISVLAIYFLGKRYFDHPSALLASFFLAFSFLHVRDSHYVYFDIPLTLSALLFFIKGHAFFGQVRRKDFAILGVLLGLAMSIKYAGALLLAPFAVFLIYNFFISEEKISAKICNLGICAGALIIVLFVCNPFAFLDFREFKRSISRLPYIQSEPFHHFTVSLFGGCGMLIVIAGFISIVRYALKIKDTRALLAWFCILFLGIISVKHSQPGERLVMPVVPLILIFAADSVFKVKQFISRHINKRASLAAITFLIFILSLPSLLRIYYVDRLFLKDDTRTLAYNWIKSNIPQDSRIGLDAITSWFPRLEKNKTQLKEVPQERRKPSFHKPKGADELKLKFLLENPHYPPITYYIFYLKNKESLGRGFLSVYPDIPFEEQKLRANNIKYVVLSRALFEHSHVVFVEAMKRNHKLLKVFSPYKDRRKLIPEEYSLPPAAAFTLKELKSRICFGPLIEIYELK